MLRSSPPARAEEMYPALPDASMLRTASSPGVFNGWPKCSGSLQLPLSNRLQRYRSNPPIPGWPVEANIKLCPSALSTGLSSSPGVLILRPKFKGSDHDPSGNFTVRYKSRPPLPPGRFETKIRSQPSKRSVMVVSQWREVMGNPTFSS